jgi:DNA-binding MarR family transcriptional regulator
MIDKMSNASRLVEKLRSKGLVERRACQNDRRQVEVLITGEGIEIVEKASILIEEGTMQYLSSLSGQDAKELNTLLDKINQ